MEDQFNFVVLVPGDKFAEDFLNNAFKVREESLAKFRIIREIFKARCAGVGFEIEPGARGVCSRRNPKEIYYVSRKHEDGKFGRIVFTEKELYEARRRLEKK